MHPFTDNLVFQCQQHAARAVRSKSNKKQTRTREKTEDFGQGFTNFHPFLHETRLQRNDESFKNLAFVSKE